VSSFICKAESRAGVAVLGMHMKVDDRDLDADFHLEEGYRNPRAAVAVGVCYRVNENLQGSAPWPQEYIHGVSEAVCSVPVRFLGGVSERPSQQVAELGRCFAATKASLAGPRAVPYGNMTPRMATMNAGLNGVLRRR